MGGTLHFTSISGENTLILAKNVYEKNSAVMGGALSFTLSVSTRILVEENAFLGNRGFDGVNHVGCGSVMKLVMAGFFLERVIFVKNKYIANLGELRGF